MCDKPQMGTPAKEESAREVEPHLLWAGESEGTIFTASRQSSGERSSR